MKFKTRIQETDISQITGETVKEVIEGKINYVAKLTREIPPHIYFLSKRGVIYNSNLFDDLELNDPLRSKLISHRGKNKEGHLPIYQPHTLELLKIEEKFGYSLKFPPPGLLEIIQNVFKNKEYECIMKNDNLKLTPCKGWFHPKTGKLVDPSYNSNEPFGVNFISGYLFHIDDKLILSKIQKYLLDEDETPLWFRLQVERVKHTALKIIESKVRMGETTAKNAELRKTNYIKTLKLTTGIEVEDWNKYLDIPKSEEETDE